MKKIFIFITVLIATGLISGVAYSKAINTISGRVTDPSGNGVANVYVDVFDLYDIWTASSSTDGDGYYSLRVPVGTYKIRLTPSPYSGYYAPKWYGNRSDSDTAALVTVRAYRTTSNINAQLEVGGRISGRVIDISGNGIGNVVVSVFDLYENWVINSYTGSNGDYISNVPEGTFRIYFIPLPSSGYYAPEWFDNQSNSQVADLVTITAGKTTSNINAQLGIGGTISGQVTDTSGEKGIANVYVTASDSIYGWTNGSSTDSNGDYSFNVPPGTYRVQYHPVPSSAINSGYYAPEWYNNKSNFQVADLLAVTSLQTVYNINASLEIGGTISGRVTDISGNGIAGVYVQAHDPNDNTMVLNGATTNVKGFYMILLAAGDYKIGFFPGPDTGNYASEWYNNKSDFQSAKTIKIRKKTTKPNVNAKLSVIEP